MYRREIIRKFSGLTAAAYLLPSGLRLHGQTIPPTEAKNSRPGLFPNLAPLQTTPYLALPLGSVRASRFGFGGNEFNGYYVGFNAEKNWVLLGKSNGTWRDLKKVPFRLKSGEPYAVRVQASGPNIAVYVSDMTKPLLEAQDNEHPSGAIGLRVWSPKYVPGRFKNLSARAA